MSTTVENTQTNMQPNIKNDECPICYDGLNGDEFCDCRQCGYVCCNKCSYNMISVCPDITAGVISNCPMCRNKENLISWDELHNDKKKSNGFIKHMYEIKVEYLINPLFSRGKWGSKTVNK